MYSVKNIDQINEIISISKQISKVLLRGKLDNGAALQFWNFICLKDQEFLKNVYDKEISDKDWESYLNKQLLKLRDFYNPIKNLEISSDIRFEDEEYIVSFVFAPVIKEDVKYFRFFLVEEFNKYKIRISHILKKS